MATIRKRGDLQFQAIIRKRVYPAQSKTFNTEREVEKWCRDVESDMERGTHVDNRAASRMTLEKALNKYWLEICKPKKITNKMKTESTRG